MKEELCSAFCGGLKIAEVPAGLAVGTAFRGVGGDSISFYIIGPDEAIGEFKMMELRFHL